VPTVASVLVPCFTASSVPWRSVQLAVRPRLAARPSFRTGVPTFSRSFSMKKGGGSGGTATRIPYVEIQDPLSESWKLGPVIDILREGGLGVIPTDTCYMFVTPIDSRKGVERIYTIKEVDSYKKKPLTLLCKDISQISTFTTATNFKSTFKMLKNLLPGPYTFIFSATNDVPRMVLEHKNRSVKTWKRREIGIRIPEDEVCREIIAQLGSPLLCAGVPRDDGDAATAVGAQDRFGKLIDFVVDNGPRELIFSTVVDWTGDAPSVLREGAGSLDALSEYMEIE